MSGKLLGGINRRQVIRAFGGTLALPLLVTARGAQAAPAAVSPGLRVRRDQPFDTGWKFFRGAGDEHSAASFDDSAWRGVDLPHDWSIEDLPPVADSGIIGPFDPKAIGGTATGFTVGGEGWYRKHFSFDGLPAAARIEILFGGAFDESDVWLNGQHVGGHVHGYTPFAYDLTAQLHPGDNVLAVRVRNIGRTSRWYSGSGLYRSVTLDVFAEPARIARWGVGIATRELTDTSAALTIDTDVEAAGVGLTLLHRIRDAAGAVVLETSIAASDHVQQEVTLASPRLWSPDSPALYTLETELRRQTHIIDAVTTDFGVRIVSFDADAGMQINGVATKMRGGCVHHDNGFLGAAAFPDADDRRVRLLKARGYNAVRSSHNPPSRSFLQACDRHGMLLISEAFDTWFAPKEAQDYSVHFREDWLQALTTMVMSERNHPSVVLWSIGNEVPMRSSAEGLETSWHLVNTVHRLDPTRPVGAAINAFAGRPMIADADTARAGFADVADQSAAMFLDVVGYNYKLDRYASDHAAYPKRVMFGSESFPHEVFDAWSFIEAHPYVVGDFVWSAMDYLGEAGVGNVVRNHAETSFPTTPAWPWVVSNCGDLDLAGQQKPASYARDVAWRVSPIEMAVLRPLPAGLYEHVSNWGWSDELQSWTWPGSEGQGLKVRVYARADRIELLLNGVSVSSRALKDGEPLPVEFQIPYAPGRLEAVAYRGAQELGRRVFETAGTPAKIVLAPESEASPSARGRLAYVGIMVTDAAGRRVPDTKHTIRLKVMGPARLAGFGSANPFAQSGFQSPDAETFDGRALLILKADGTPGTVSIAAEGDGLQPGAAAIRLTDAANSSNG